MDLHGQHEDAVPAGHEQLALLDAILLENAFRRHEQAAGGPVLAADVDVHRRREAARLADAVGLGHDLHCLDRRLCVSRLRFG